MNDDDDDYDDDDDDDEDGGDDDDDDDDDDDLTPSAQSMRLRRPKVQHSSKSRVPSRRALRGSRIREPFRLRVVPGIWVTSGRLWDWARVVTF